MYNIVVFVAPVCHVAADPLIRHGMFSGFVLVGDAGAAIGLADADRHTNRAGKRIEYDHRGAAIVCFPEVPVLLLRQLRDPVLRINIPGDRLQCLVFHPQGSGDRGGEECLRVVIRVLDAAPAENIVELIEADIAPRLFEILGSVPHTRGL